MKQQNSKFYTLISWLQPSAIELVVISTLSVLTLALSNVVFFQDLVFLPKDFSLKAATLDSLNNFIVKLVGDSIARSVVVAVFWASIGLLVYIMIWLLLNFSNELGNDLAVTRYMHPRNVDTNSPWRSYLSRVSFQITALVVFIFYLNVSFGALIPYCGGLFKSALMQWPSLVALKYAVIGLASELVVLHVMILLIRTLMLRKRVFH